MPPERTNNAICLSVSQAFAQVDVAHRVFQATTPHILHHATAFAWHVNPENARHVAYAFGVAGGRVVSAYRVDVPSSDWPVMPAGSADHARGRRVIPLTEVSEAEWNTATSWSGVRMYGAVRYLSLDVDANGTWLGLGDDLTDPAQLTPEEQLRSEG